MSWATSPPTPVCCMRPTTVCPASSTHLSNVVVIRDQPRADDASDAQRKRRHVAEGAKLLKHAARVEELRRHGVIGQNRACARLLGCVCVGRGGGVSVLTTGLPVTSKCQRLLSGPLLPANLIHRHPRHNPAGKITLQTHIKDEQRRRDHVVERPED